MRTEEEVRSRSEHPAGKAAEKPVVESPYRSFFDTLDDLENTRLLHGAASLEVEMLAARVRKQREAVIAAWKAAHQAA